MGALEPVTVAGRGAWAAQARAGSADGPPWTSGLVGWLGYEAGAWFERMPDPVSGRLLPDAWWGRVGPVVVLDRDGTVRYRRGVPLDALTSPPARVAAPPRAHRLEEPADETFLDGVRTVLDHLRAGDCYQVNLSRRVVARGRFDPLATWLHVRSNNESRRGLFIQTDSGAILANSPELLLRARGRRALSVPIKGTAAAETDPSDLRRSEKERAELTMIVDLVRAELGRIAEPGSVRTGARRVGRVGHLWHAMQRVLATLPPGRDAVDALAALFPPGSVTGAPKVRAMEVIRALERVPRGVYCGASGWMGPAGADMNVAIRTISIRGDEAHVQAGSGLVLHSVPERELAEARLKAVRLLEAL